MWEGASVEVSKGKAPRCRSFLNSLDPLQVQHASEVERHEGQDDSRSFSQRASTFQSSRTAIQATAEVSLP
jgi:hypothetical protein